jgi:menaquinone-dependent protoporphyrinogen oxidase
VKILIFYTSVEGQTRKIADAIAARIEEKGGSAAIMNVTSMAEFSLERPDAVILCSPIHAGRYPTPFVDFVHRESAWLNSQPSAFVSVSLSIHSDDATERTEAEKYPDALMAETGWKPAAIHHAAGALRFTEYDFFKRWMVKRIAKKDATGTSRASDIEFTDWAALNAFIDDFVAAVAED